MTYRQRSMGQQEDTERQAERRSSSPTTAAELESAREFLTQMEGLQEQNPSPLGEVMVRAARRVLEQTEKDFKAKEQPES